MKKKLISILLCVALGAMMAGCGSGDKGADAEKSEEKKEVEKISIQMTDSYTFEDPADLEFDQRIVLKGDKSCKLLTDMSNMGYEAEAIYEIMYAKDGLAVASYEYFVTADEASATALAEFYTSQGRQITQEGNVLYGYLDADMIQATITTFASSGTIKDETPEAYMEMMESFNGLVKY